MIVCALCGVKMKCSKNNVGCDFGHGHVYSGDRYKCPVCNAEIVDTASDACFDPLHEGCSTYVTMMVEDE